MWQFLGRRLAMGGITVFATTIAVTLLIHLVPGDPVQIMYAQSQGTTPAEIEAIRHGLGLDQPIYVQYLKFLGGLVHGDLGFTIRGHQPVLDVILERLPNTLILAGTAMALAIAIGLPIGFLAAYKRGTFIDAGLMVAAIGGVSIPHFWLGLMLMFLFSLKLGWLPVSGTGPLNLVLPALTLGLSNAAIVARMTRSSMIEILQQDFVRTAESKGLSRAVVLRRHVLRAGLCTNHHDDGPAILVHDGRRDRGGEHLCLERRRAHGRRSDLPARLSHYPGLHHDFRCRRGVRFNHHRRHLRAG